MFKQMKVFMTVPTLRKRVENLQDRATINIRTTLALQRTLPFLLCSIFTF